ncbi:MAG: YbaK/EbsC family protein [Anaerolineae bacterium]|nr:YbaK/EbsC family protein [Anaerolineae bacterium]
MENQNTKPLSASAQAVQDKLIALGYANRVLEMPDSTRSAAEAAQAVGCDVQQIAKSIIFKASQSGKAVLVVTSGSNRVDEKKVRALLGEPLKKADADFVREQTGFAIGGVPPLGHVQPTIVYIDQDLLKLKEIWAAAGTPYAVFKLSPEELVKMTGGQVADVRVENIG